MTSHVSIPIAQHGKPNSAGNIWQFAVIFIVAIAAYWPALGAGFVWDDDGFVTRPEMQSLHGLWRIWFDVGSTEQYYPVLHSAFWLEHRIWGGAAGGYHLTNVLLHAASACLLAAILRRWWPMRGAFLAALLFALHPVCAESVAWIAEQKNTLSTAFYLAAALMYLRFDEERKPRRYLAGLALFALALLSKSVAASLPAALLVVIWWRRGKLSWNRDIFPLLPWFALGAGTGLFTAWVERKFVGAQGQLSP
jgi:hypothetical protein